MYVMKNKISVTSVA